MKFKDVEKNFKKALKKYKAIFITFALFLLLGVICLVLDYFNIPYRLGFNFNFLNLDFWSIFLGNGIVVALFITTFILFDKRNLEKDKLSTYAGTLLLKDIYGKIGIFIKVLENYLNDEEDDIEINEKQMDYLKTSPFKSDDKIFECLENGQISKERFDAYKTIKMYYEMLIYYALENNDYPEIKKFCYENLTEKFKAEKEIIDAYIKE